MAVWLINMKIDYSKYLTFTPSTGGEYYRLDIPVGVEPPAKGTKINLLGTTVVTLNTETPLDIAKGRGGPVARSMEKNGIAYLVNCLPEGHEWLKEHGSSQTKPIIRAEIAKTQEDHLRGLMGRKYLPYNNGMLFDFGKEKKLSFWMANTYIPLQIAFIKESGKIGQIEKMAPLSTRAVRSNSEYRYALELNDGWFDNNKIQIGAQVQIPGQEEQTQPAISPDVPIAQSYKDILKHINNYRMKIIIEYTTKGNIDLPPKTIEPPFEFKETAEGDADGLVTAWDCQKGRFSNFIIENIISIKDLNGNPIINTQDVERIYKNVPLTPKEEQSVKGKTGTL